MRVYNWLSSLFFLILMPSAFAADEQALIDADKIDFAQQERIVSALGNVQVRYAGKVLLADKVTYNLLKDEVAASGNVKLTDENGSASYADSMQLEKKFARGIALRFRAELQAGAHVAAAEAERFDAEHMQLRDVSYSACGRCDIDAKERLPWKFNAQQANIDVGKERISYRNMWMTTYGLPMFYTPYFSHPTPNAKPKSGFLMPEYGAGSDYGPYLSVPLYLRIAPNIDATIKPTIYSRENPLFTGEYRHLFANGTINVKGSMIVPRNTPRDYRYTIPHMRGHVFAEGEHRNSAGWVSGFGVRRSSDPTYLKKFRFSDDIFLKSEIYLHRYQERQFMSLRGLDYQGLRETDVPTQMPVALPIINYHIENDPDSTEEARLASDSNLMFVTRTDGPDVRRVLQHFTWQKLYALDNGLLLNWTNGVRLDAYDVNEVPRPGFSANKFTGNRGHVLPFTQLDMRYPLVKRGARQYIVLEPLLSVYSSPASKPSTNIPNQDTTLVELTPENLFQTSRFLGQDKIEGGTRASYGLRGGSYYYDGFGGSVMVGQHYHKRNKDFYQRGSGMEGRLSDYLTQFHFKPISYLDLLYRMRIDKKKGNIRGNQAAAIFNFDPLVFSATYTALIDERQLVRRVHYLGNSVGLKLKDDWYTEMGSEFNFANHQVTQKKLVKFYSKLVYNHPCYKVAASFERTFMRDRDVRPQSLLNFTLILKTL